MVKLRGSMSTWVSSAITRSWIARAFATNAESAVCWAPAIPVNDTSAVAERSSRTLPFRMSTSWLTVSCPEPSAPSLARLTCWRSHRGVGHRRAFGPVLGTVPAVPVVIDFMNLPVFPVAHAIQCLDPCVSADGLARIDRLDVTDFREDLELHVLVGQCASPEQRKVAQRATVAVRPEVKVGSQRRSLKLTRHRALRSPSRALARARILTCPSLTAADELVPESHSVSHADSR